MVQLLGFLSPTWEIWIEFQVATTCLPHSWLLYALGNETEDDKSYSICLTVSLAFNLKLLSKLFFF